MILAGRGWGKTKTLSEWVIDQSRHHARIALIGETAADCRDVLVLGESGIMACSPPWWRPVYQPSARSLVWPNGATALLFSGGEPDQLRGPQHEIAAIDELAKYPAPAELWAQLRFGLRLGSWPRTLITTTPRPLALLRKLIADPKTYVTRGSTYDNIGNLAPTFGDMLREFEGTRLGQQEINGEIVDDVPNALWTYEQLAECFYSGPIPDFERVIIGVDPSGGSKRTSDWQGIVVVGKGVDGFFYVVEDCTMRGTPPQWGARVARAHREHDASEVVIEVTYGAEMATNVLNQTGHLMRVREAHARRSKSQRADPLSALYAQKKVRHLGRFTDLIDQMVLMATDGFHGDGSPDRVDALVWAFDPIIPIQRVVVTETW